METEARAIDDSVRMRGGCEGIRVFVKERRSTFTAAWVPVTNTVPATFSTFQPKTLRMDSQEWPRCTIPTVMSGPLAFRGSIRRSQSKLR